jgi:hypothetical protein
MVRRYVTGLGTIVPQFAFALVAHDFGHPRKDRHEKLLAAVFGRDSRPLVVKSGSRSASVARNGDAEMAIVPRHVDNREDRKAQGTRAFIAARLSWDCDGAGASPERPAPGSSRGVTGGPRIYERQLKRKRGVQVRVDVPL